MQSITESTCEKNLKNLKKSQISSLEINSRKNNGWSIHTYLVYYILLAR